MDHPPPHSDMDAPIPLSPLWEWSDFLDFSLEGELNIPIGSDQPPAAPDEVPDQESQGRVRKRDPRLTCPNFLAGRVPCACPEVDEMLREDEALPGKKRARAASGTAACQVPECEADISGLKGYHRRHRVCLRCANASAVVLDGQKKRYCQQCGKFHILSDFDEGKRSCRRKLERHNNRRRRKPNKSRDAIDREPQEIVLVDDATCDDENRKDSLCLSSQLAEGGPLLESDDGQISALCSDLGSQNIRNDGVVSTVACGEAQIDREKDELRYAHSSSYCDSKSALSAMGTGRISFKLYDWNPAEFPRRLRQQIFHWLSNMPVELEGYIRPGCTILTVFIVMPNFMWSKLLEDPFIYIRNFVTAPGAMLSGRGDFLVYLENMIFHVVKGEPSVLVQEQAPKLHYVHPTCFEAGKPIEFVACGSNLLQPRFRFLISFAGKYLAHDYCLPFQRGDIEGAAASLDHQLLKICIPHTEEDLFGPAFIEVDNESGISNFIPILIGNKEICDEVKIMERRFKATFCSKGSKFMDTGSLSRSCELSVLGQMEFSKFILDVAWLLRKPSSEDIRQIPTSSQIGRFNQLLTCLIQNESTSLLERVLHYVETVMDNTELNNPANFIADTDMKSLQSNLSRARKILVERLQDKGALLLHSRNLVEKGNCEYQTSQVVYLSVSLLDQDASTTERDNLETLAGSNVLNQNDKLPLLNGEVVVSMKLPRENPRKSSNHVFSNKFLGSRPLIFAIAAAAVCLGICAVILHPENIGKIATTIRRCLLNTT